MPYSERAKYEHHRQEKPGDFDPKTFRDIPLSHTGYRGKKFDKDKDRAVVGKKKGYEEREKRSGKKEKEKIQTILVPKDDPKPKKDKKDPKQSKLKFSSRESAEHAESHMRKHPVVTEKMSNESVHHEKHGWFVHFTKERKAKREAKRREHEETKQKLEAEANATIAGTKQTRIRVDIPPVEDVINSNIRKQEIENKERLDADAMDQKIRIEKIMDKYGNPEQAARQERHVVKQMRDEASHGDYIGNRRDAVELRRQADELERDIDVIEKSVKDRGKEREKTMKILTDK